MFQVLELADMSHVIDAVDEYVREVLLVSVGSALSNLAPMPTAPVTTTEVEELADLLRTATMEALNTCEQVRALT